MHQNATQGPAFQTRALADCETTPHSGNSRKAYSRSEVGFLPHHLPMEVAAQSTAMKTASTWPGRNLTVVPIVTPGPKTTEVSRTRQE